MANRKPKIMIPPPSTGVRKDINPLVRDATMANEGDNCLYFDGTIRPRPALTKEVNNPTTGEPIFTQYPEMYNTESQATVVDHSIEAAIHTSDGYIICAINDLSLDLSVDNGQTFSIGALAYPGANVVYNLEEYNGYLFAFDSNEDIYRAPAATLPSSLSWTLVGSAGSVKFTPSTKFIYDETNDAIIMMSGLVSVIDVLYDATEVTPSDDSINMPSTSFSGFILGEADWVNESYIVVGTRNLSGVGRQQYLESFSFAWGGAAYAAGSTVEAIQICEDANKLLLPEGTDPAYVDIVEVVLAIPNYSDVIFASFGYSGYTLSHVCRITINPDGTFDSDSLSFTEVDVDGTGVVSDYEVTGSDLSLLLAPPGGWGTAEKWPRYIVSKDRGATWMQFFDDRDIGSTDFLGGYLVNSNERHMMFISYFHIPGYGTLHALPSSQGGFLVGDVTTIVQADMSDEDNVLVIGATHGLARLNRSTNEWDRITANDSETVDGDNAGSPDGDWNDGGSGTGYDADIPPLSAYSDDANYVEGVSISGVYGSHPWVFRTFEAQGETFLVGTNGQCYPIIYHPDMPGGFARRLGEMTVDDPNYNATPVSGSALGDLAPKAKCIASVGGTLILANDPGGNGYEISVSAYNDPDRSWGDHQEVLLGDTPGQIVSMNEISANQCAIYKEDAIYHAIAQVEFLGVSAPFRFELSKAGISGPCSPNSVVRNYDGRQMYLARDGGAYLYDGVAPIDLGANIRKMIQSDIDLNNLGKCWGLTDTKRKLVWFFYPSADHLVNKGIAVSTDQGAPYPVWPIVLPQGWEFSTGIDAVLTTDVLVGDLGILSSYDDDATLDSFSSGRSAMLMGMKTGIFFSHQYQERSEQYTDDGLPIRIHLQGGWLTPGGAEQYTADTIHHIFSCSDVDQELEVRLRAQQLGRNIRTSKASPLSSGKRQRRTRHRVSGTQFSIDIQGDIRRIFNWGGGPLSLVKRGGR